MRTRTGQSRAARIPWNRVEAFQRDLLDWYEANGRMFLWRHHSAGHYVRIVSEILLQRTTAAAVNAVLPNFIKQFPSWKHLAGTPESELQEWLRPLGLWQRRSTALVSLAKAISDDPEPLSDNRSDLEKLPAVGQYVASAILLFVHDRKEPLLDSNMSRVLERYFGNRELADIRYDPYLQALSRRVVDCTRPIKMNWAILDLGALICTPKAPRCHQCPVARRCVYARALPNPD